MRIREVETLLLSYQFPDSERLCWSAGDIHGWSAAFVRIHSDSGLHGVGEIYFGSFVPETIPAIVADLKRHLIGEDPYRIGYLWSKLNQVTKFWNRTGFGKAVIAGIDLALYDLVGKTTGLPVYQLLGGLWRPEVRTYASAGCSDRLDTLRAEVRQFRDAGFRAYKWRLVDPRNAAEFMAALREEAGPDFDLMVDIVQGSAPNPWPRAEVARVAGELSRHFPRWLEEPYTVEDLRSYAELRQRGLCSIAGGEGITCLEEAAAFLEAHAVDYLQPDATIAGGITLCRQIATLATRHNTSMAWHSWGAGVSLMANLHLALATPATDYVEYCQVRSPFREGILLETPALTNGFLQPPRTPGLGIHLSDAVLDRYPYRGTSGHSFSWNGSTTPIHSTQSI